MMPAGGGLRAAAKRTAFGDLSNTSKLGAAAQDDSVVNGKSYDVKKVQVASTTTLLRPPMRSAAPVNHVLPPAKHIHQAVPSKRSNAVFKDSDHEHLVSNAPAEIQARFNGNAKLLTERHSESQIDYELPAIEAGLGSVQDSYELNLAREEAYQKAEEARKRAELSREVQKQEEESNELYKQWMRSLMSGGLAANGGDDLDQDRGVTGEGGAVDPEEAWDMEEDDDDDQDYTTAHSFRSKGDNTTGGVTTVIFPRFTDKVRDEIEAAAELVESTRSKQDIEEEAWDTSMVAEYSDEIFSYMKEQEVGLLLILPTLCHNFSSSFANKC